VVEDIAVFIPTTLAGIFNNGPPELPGLIGVWVLPYPIMQSLCAQCRTENNQCATISILGRVQVL
jgi:hypothetical protein